MPFLAVSAWAGNPLVGDWTFDGGRTVAIREDQTAEVFHPDTGEREGVGEWRMDAAGGCVISWKSGDRHVVKIVGDGDTLQGTLHIRGRLGAQTASAERAPSAVEDTAAYFGSASPTGGPTDSGQAAVPEEEEAKSEPPAMDEDPYADKMGDDAEVPQAPVARVETQTILLPADAKLVGGLLIERSSGTIANWKDGADSASWSVAHLKPGKYNVAIEHSVGMGRNGGRFEVSTGSGKLSVLARTTGGWKTFKRKPIGSIEIAEDDTELRFTATDVDAGASLMNIRSVELRRQ